MTHFINQSYSFIQWYSRTGHDQLMDILTVFSTVLFHLMRDVAGIAIAVFNWLLNTFNSCEVNYLVVPPLSTEEGYITHAVVLSDLRYDIERMMFPVVNYLGRLRTAMGIAVEVVRELV